MDLSLEGKVVAVTGASSGIGEAIARACAEAGAKVSLGARREDRINDLAKELGGEAIVTDVSDEAQAKAFVDQTRERLGGLDVLVSNHAGMVFGNFDEVSPEDFDRSIDVTFTGAVNLIRAAMPHLERTGGTIVVTGSIMARVPLPTFSSYASAKHALRGFVATLRVELRARRSPVSISMVHPGAVDTPLWDHVSSARGVLPRNPPDLYSPETMARAIVAAAVRPRPEFTVGGEARIIEMGWAYVRPVAELVLTLVSRFYSSGRTAAPPGGLLRAPTGTGRASGGRHGRPSLWAWLRLGAPYRRR